MTKRVVGVIAAVLAASCARGALDQSSAIVPITPFADSCPQIGTPGTLTKLRAFPDDLPKLFGTFGPCRAGRAARC